MKIPPIYTYYFFQLVLCILIGQELQSAEQIKAEIREQYDLLHIVTDKTNSDTKEYLDILDLYENLFDSRRSSNLKAAPYLHALKNYEAAKIKSYPHDAASAIESISSQSDDNPLANDHQAMLTFVQHYPRLFEYCKAYIYRAAAYKSGSLAYTADVLQPSAKPLVVHKGTKVLVYPTRLSQTHIFSKLRVNGTEIQDRYLWKPTHAGTYVFEVEYKYLEGIVHKVSRQFEFEVQ